jgi:hypothetical protein
MLKSSRIVGLALLVLLTVPLLASAMVEPDTKREYSDELTVGEGDAQYTLVGTGVALREKTILKVDVYVIASYVCSKAKFEGDENAKAAALLGLDGNKRLIMDLTRGFSAEKLKGAFSEVIEKNYDDMSAFQDDMDGFLAYFTKDAEEGDNLVFDYQPQVGLTTILNGETKGVINNFEFVKALWTVWFGEKPANGGMKKALVANI